MPAATLTFGPQPKTFGVGGLPPHTACHTDVLICLHASHGAGGSEPRWQAPDRPPLYAINGRVC